MSKLSEEFAEAARRSRDLNNPFGIGDFGAWAQDHADAILAALRAHETGASAAERMRERAAKVAENHYGNLAYRRAVADAIRALPTDGE